jgi:hypothetical protein
MVHDLRAFLRLASVRAPDPAAALEVVKHSGAKKGFVLLLRW